jgi:CRP/FNR family transcriptional regulator, cyclic AMP receptor protein
VSLARATVGVYRPRHTLPIMGWRLLSDVAAEDVRMLLSVARRRRFQRGEVVFHRDDPGDSLHLIVSGRFAIRVMTPLGDMVWIAVRGPGENFGEMALVEDDARRSATVSALEDAETFAVRKPEFDGLRQRYPGIDRVLIAFLAGEIRTLDERLLEALYLPVDRRLLRRLRELSEVYRQPDGSAVIPLTQEELAEFAGAARATVNRVLREEQARGTLELQRGKTRILNQEELATRAR